MMLFTQVLAGGSTGNLNPVDIHALGGSLDHEDDVLPNAVLKGARIGWVKVIPGIALRAWLMPELLCVTK